MWAPQDEKKRNTAQAERGGAGIDLRGPPQWNTAGGPSADRARPAKEKPSVSHSTSRRSEADLGRADSKVPRSQEELRSTKDKKAGEDSRSYGFRRRASHGEAGKTETAGLKPAKSKAYDGANSTKQQHGHDKETYGGYQKVPSSEHLGGAGQHPQQTHGGESHGAPRQTASGSHNHGGPKPAPSLPQNSKRPGERTCYYQALGVHPKASDEELKKAYRSKAMEWHPDKNAHRKEESERMFKEIGESYEVLRDPTRRALYDNYGFDVPKVNASQDTRAQAQNQFRSARDIFAEFFGEESSNFGFGGSGLGLRDPFSFLFGDANPARHSNRQDPFANHGFSSGFSRASPFADPFFTSGRSFMQAADPFASFHDPPLYSQSRSGRGMAAMDAFQMPPLSNFNNQTSMSFSFFGDGGGGGGGGSRQTTTSIVNGQRTVTTKVTDSQGNVTITQELPNGQRTTTVNGVQSAPMLGAQAGTHRLGSSGK